MSKEQDWYNAANAINVAAAPAVAWAERENAIKRQIGAQKELADYQHDINMAVWEKEKAYNLPSAQMQRFKDAGLNPNLMYGKGTAGNATQGPQYKGFDPASAPFSKSIGAAQMLSSYQDMQIKNAQLSNLRAQEEATRQSTVNEGAKLLGIQSDSKLKDWNKFWYEAPKSWLGTSGMLGGQLADTQLQIQQERLRSIRNANASSDRDNKYWEALKITQNPMVNALFKAVITAMGSKPPVNQNINP